MNDSKYHHEQAAPSLVRSVPRLLLQLEGATLFAVATVWYFASGGGWALLLALFLAPDLSMLGYLAGRRSGALAYNLFHSYPLPAILLGLAYFAAAPVISQVALVWLAHIGIDRMVGYGLKYPTDFKDTHLQRL